MSTILEKNMYENDFLRIAEASSKNSLSIFVGAGVSALSNAPKWKDMIDQICDEIKIKRKKSYSTDEYLQIPQIYYNEINRDKNVYYSFLNRVLDVKSLSYNEIHKLLLKLKPNSIITTNFDELIEMAAADACYSMKVVASDNEVAHINGSRFILKVHGDLKHRNIVFKEEDYLSYSENFKLIETILKSIFSTNTVLFVGYGLNDYNIKLIMNWAKSLLKDSFNTPIFLYTDTEKLTEAQLKYHISRGLSVIDFHKYLLDEDESVDYFFRYKTLIERILDYPENNLNASDKYKRFDWAHKKLNPLKEMDALRPIDISNTLRPHIIIENSGHVVSLHRDYNVLEYFYELNKNQDDLRENLESSINRKYDDILSVFEKALILESSKEINFGDQLCISFSFKQMRRYVSKNYSSTKKNYIKAFYLSKLSRFKEAFDLFSEVAIEAFNTNDYILFYLTQINRNSLYYTIKSLNRNLLYCNEVKIHNIDEVNVDFSKFPIEFQNMYSAFKDLNSLDRFLYHNFYNTYVKSKKLEGRIEGTSAGTAISPELLLNLHYDLHFILGNHLFLDEFSEYKESVKYSMSMLLEIYSQQNQLSRANSLQNIFGKEKVSFSYIDFYLFINCFDSKEIGKALKDSQIDLLLFSEINLIEKSIKNIIEYYEDLVLEKASLIELNSIELKIKTCLVLLKYIEVSNILLDNVIEFLLKHEFREILIDDKVFFLDQIFKKHIINSNKAKRLIENAFYKYFDIHLVRLAQGEEFELISRTRLNYYSLINYFFDNKKRNRNRKIDLRVLNAVNSNYYILIEPILEYYYEYLSKSTKKAVRRWAVEYNERHFNFRIFAFLLDENNKDNIEQLKKYLKRKYLESKSNNPVYILNTDLFDELNAVGYWCFSGLLSHDLFKEFVGLSNTFDFYFLYDKFDFSRFDLMNFLELRSHVYEKIAENNEVKEKIRICISKALKNNEFHYKDAEKLKQILVDYFC